MDKVEKTDLVNLFLRNKPAFILMKIHSCQKKCYASIIAKNVDWTYSHTIRIIKIFEKNKILIFEKEGRIKTIKLTKKGKKISEALKKLITNIHEEWILIMNYNSKHLYIRNRYELIFIMGGEKYAK